MSIGARVFNFMVFIWLAGGLCLSFPNAAKFFAGGILFSCILCIPRINEVFFWILFSGAVFWGVTKVL